MSGSGFATAATDLGALHERISAASATLGNFEFPGTGLENGVAEAFAAVKASITADAESAGQYATDAAKACSTQAEIDHGLELAPTPADLNALLRQAQESGDPEAKAEFDAAVDDYKQARTAHENSTLGNCLPTPVGTCGVPIGVSGEGSEDTLAGEDEDDDDGDLSGLDGEGNEGEDTPVTMSEGGESAPVTMSTGTEPEAPVRMSDGLPPPTPLSDNAVSTETSADSTIPPTAGAGNGTLSQPQPTPGGQPIQGAHGTPNPTFGPSGGTPGQLSSNTGSKPSTPKNPQRKDDDTTSAPVTGVAGVTGVASTAAPSSPASTPPGTGTPPPTTPPTGASPTAPGQGGTGQGGVGGGGLAGAGARPPQQPLGSGETVTGQENKPIYRYEPELLPGDPDYDWFTYDEDTIDTDDKKGAA